MSLSSVVVYGVCFPVALESLDADRAVYAWCESIFAAVGWPPAYGVYDVGRALFGV